MSIISVFRALREEDTKFQAERFFLKQKGKIE